MYQGVRTRTGCTSLDEQQPKGHEEAWAGRRLEQHVDVLKMGYLFQLISFLLYVDNDAVAVQTLTAAGVLCTL